MMTGHASLAAFVSIGLSNAVLPGASFLPPRLLGEQANRSNMVWSSLADSGLPEAALFSKLAPHARTFALDLLVRGAFDIGNRSHKALGMTAIYKEFQSQSSPTLSLLHVEGVKKHGAGIIAIECDDELLVLLGAIVGVHFQTNVNDVDEWHAVTGTTAPSCVAMFLTHEQFIKWYAEVMRGTVGIEMEQQSAKSRVKQSVEVAKDRDHEIVAWIATRDGLCEASGATCTTINPHDNFQSLITGPVSGPLAEEQAWADVEPRILKSWTDLDALVVRKRLMVSKTAEVWRTAPWTVAGKAHAWITSRLGLGIGGVLSVTVFCLWLHLTKPSRKNEDKKKGKKRQHYHPSGKGKGN